MEHLPLAAAAGIVFGGPVAAMLWGVYSGDFAKWRQELPTWLKPLYSGN